MSPKFPRWEVLKRGRRKFCSRALRFPSFQIGGGELRSFQLLLSPISGSGSSSQGADRLSGCKARDCLTMGKQDKRTGRSAQSGASGGEDSKKYQEQSFPRVFGPGSHEGTAASTGKVQGAGARKPEARSQRNPGLFLFGGPPNLDVILGGGQYQSVPKSECLCKIVLKTSLRAVRHI